MILLDTNANFKNIFYLELIEFYLRNRFFYCNGKLKSFVQLIVTTNCNQGQLNSGPLQQCVSEFTAYRYQSQQNLHRWNPFIFSTIVYCLLRSNNNLLCVTKIVYLYHPLRPNHLIVQSSCLPLLSYGNYYTIQTPP